MIKNIFSGFSQKLTATKEDIALINKFKHLYYLKHADWQEYKEIIQNYFDDKNSKNQYSFIPQKIECKNGIERELTILQLQWYKEFFDSIKKSFDYNKDSDETIKNNVLKKIQNSHYEEVYNAIEKYCYSPIINNYEKFDYEHNKPFNENINVFINNQKKLLMEKRQIIELIFIHKETRRYIEDIKQGYIDIKIENQKLKGFECGYEDYLSINKQSQSIINDFQVFIKSVNNMFNNVKRLNISEHWLKLINVILYGYSGVSGLKMCSERINNLANPLVLMKLLEITKDTNLTELKRQTIKEKIRDKLILAPFCWPFLEKLRRLYNYLENKEIRLPRDEELFVIVKSLNDDLIKLLKSYNIHLHNISLFKKYNSEKNIIINPNNNNSFLASIEQVKFKIDNYLSNEKLNKNLIYDIDVIGYDIICKNTNQIKNSAISKIFIYRTNI